LHHIYREKKFGKIFCGKSTKMPFFVPYQRFFVIYAQKSTKQNMKQNNYRETKQKYEFKN